jgi:osmoprotectant transport system permease protein
VSVAAATLSGVRDLALPAGQQLLDWGWVHDNVDTITTALRQHVSLTLQAVVFGFLLSLPVAVLLRRFRWLQGTVLGVASVLYTIPGIAALFILGPYTGYISRTTIDIVLISYTLLILIRNIVTGLDQVSPDVREAARGMGLSPGQMLVRVELPLALPSILAGLRIATVTTIGLATLASFVSQGGLGDLIITQGMAQQFPTAVIVGSVLAVLLAVLADVVFVGLGWLAAPWSRRQREVKEPDEPSVAPADAVEVPA